MARCHQRHLHILLIFLALTVMFAIRSVPSLSIVIMTAKSDSNTKTYDYTSIQRSAILSSLTGGYVLTQIPASLLTYKFGPKIMLQITLLVNSVISILTPFLIPLDGYLLFAAARFVMGATQGALFPSIHSLISKWIPLHERGMLTILAFTGIQFGIVVITLLNGVIVSTFGGWQSLFIFSGILGFFWCLIWHFFGFNTPQTCPRITPEELEFIEQSYKETGHIESEKKLPIPWSDILTSRPFYALLFTHTASNWNFWLLVANVPSYLQYVLGIEITKNVFRASLPYLLNIAFGFIFFIVANLIDTYNLLSINARRKFFNSCAIGIPGILLFITALVQDHSKILALICVCLVIGFSAASACSYLINHIDLSPNFAPILMGITNTCGTLAGFVSPLFQGYIVTDQNNTQQWGVVFYSTGAILFIGNLIFVIFGETKLQPWDAPKIVQEPTNVKQ